MGLVRGIINFGKKTGTVATDVAKGAGNLAVDAGKAAGGALADGTKAVVKGVIGSPTRPGSPVTQSPTGPLMPTAPTKPPGFGLPGQTGPLGVKTPNSTMTPAPVAAPKNVQLKPLAPLQPVQETVAPKVVQVQAIKPQAPQVVTEAPAQKTVQPIVAKPVVASQPVEEQVAAPAKAKTATPAQPAPAPTPEQDIQALRDAAAKMMTATEDPVAAKAFNQAVANFGLVNQAQRDLLQQQINQDPGLAGQGAGHALLGLLAREQGFQASDLLGKLSIESANRVRDLNQWGFDRLASITEYRDKKASSARQELLDAGDFDGYAEAFERDTGMPINVEQLRQLSPAVQSSVQNLQEAMAAKIRAGDMAGAQELFGKIQALAPDLFQGMQFQDVVTGAEAYQARTAQQEEVLGAVRLQVARGDTASALKGLDAAFTPQELQARGAQAIQSQPLADIDAALKAAGMMGAADAADLIGREADVAKALEVAKIRTESGKTTVDRTVAYLDSELRKSGFDTTDPERARALRSYALNLQLTGGLKVDAQGNVQLDANALIPPWDPKSPDAHLFSDWPVLAADGSTMDPGWEPYGDSNPRPAPDSAMGQYYEDLDAKWENYLLKTRAADRLTREEWFHATKAGTQAPDPKEIPPGIKEPEQPAGDPLTDADIFAKVRGGEALTPEEEKELVKSGRVPTYTVQDLANTTPTDLINAESAGLALLNGKLVKVLPEKGEYAHHTYGSAGGLAGRQYRRYTWIKVQVGDKTYKVDNRGNWYAGDAVLPDNAKNIPKTVPDPTK